MTTKPDAWDYGRHTYIFPRVIQVRIAEDMHEWLTVRAVRDGSSRSDVIRDLLQLGMLADLAGLKPHTIPRPAYDDTAARADLRKRMAALWVEP